MLGGVSIRRREAGQSNKTLLIFGIATNLSLLVYFKYLNFFIDNINTLDGMKFSPYQH